MVMLRTSIAVCIATLLLVVTVACRSSKPDSRAPVTPAQTAPVADPAAPVADPAAEPPRTTAPAEPAPPPALVAKPEPAACPPKVRPAKCPATEPNVNRPCSPKGIECTYAPGCCPPVYVCNKNGRFEARFTRC
jgi:hypothetical protein